MIYKHLNIYEQCDILQI